MFMMVVCKNVLILEPGYYEDGSFGIRLETAVVVVNASTPVCKYVFKN